MTKEELLSLSKEELAELVEICSKNAIAMDGVWFQSVERKFGMDEAIFHDEEAWRRYTVIAQSLRKRQPLPRRIRRQSTDIFERCLPRTGGAHAEGHAAPPLPFRRAHRVRRIRQSNRPADRNGVPQLLSGRHRSRLRLQMEIHLKKGLGGLNDASFEKPYEIFCGKIFNSRI